MKRKAISIPFLFFCIAILSCSSKKESAASIGQKWCDLNSKAQKAEVGTQMLEAKVALKKFEKDIEEKYKGNDSFMKEIENEAEKCEDASEGR